MASDLRRLDGDAAFLLVLAGVCETSFTSLRASDDTSLRHQGVSERGFSVIHMSDDGHVTDVLLFVHHGTDFVDGKVDLKARRISIKIFISTQLH